MKPKIQFILKRRDDFNPAQHSPKGMSTGLFNSASFMQEMLTEAGYEAELQVAIDNNCIDRLVTNFRPDFVIIEALWVVPTKFNVLTSLHPDVKWVIRLHSELPFIAGEGMAMDWLAEYIKFPQICIGVNAPRMLNETRTYLVTACGLSEQEVEERVVYLPNYYPKNYRKKVSKTPNRYLGQRYWLDVGCFGAVRPLKNHVLQAMAAIKYCNYHGKQLRFHINSGRIEGKGDPVMNNLLSMFEHMADHGHKLVLHEWAPRDQFLELCSQMDVGLQCSLSETFNIVCADLISQGVPIVGSPEVPWSSDFFNAKPGDSDEIFHAISRAIEFSKINVWINKKNLTKYTKQTRKIWLRYFKIKR
jgi:hypothetical protein